MRKARSDENEHAREIIERTPTSKARGERMGNAIHTISAEALVGLVGLLALGCQAHGKASGKIEASGAFDGEANLHAEASAKAQA
ncbi:MAG: hypothetical protein ACOC1F_10270, partial [Myxococcota bacterium]